MERMQPDESLLEMVDGQRRGIRRVVEAAEDLGIDLARQVLTSRDDAGRAMADELALGEVREGLTRWQLPQAPDCKHALFFLDRLDAGTRIPTHRHRDNTFKMVIAGSIVVHGKKLTEADWLYVPKGVDYGFEVGDSGAVLCNVWYDEIPPEFA